MKNYLKTQQNEFGQNVGFSLNHNLSIQPISGVLKGQYINLIDVAEGLSEQAASSISALSTCLLYVVPRVQRVMHTTGRSNAFGAAMQLHTLHNCRVC